MDDAQRFQLFYGPYKAPRLKPGSMVYCEVRRKKVPVGKLSKAKIPWPRKGGYDTLIVFAGLAQAVRREAVQSVAHHFGVSIPVAGAWRRALRVPKLNPGTRKLQRVWYNAYMHYRRHPDTPPPRPAGRVKPVPRGRRRRSADFIQRMKRSSLFGKGWTPREDRLLGTTSDKRLVPLLGRTINSIRSRRAQLGIPQPPYRPEPWTRKEEKLLGTMPDAEVARKLARLTPEVRARRLFLNIPPPPLQILGWTQRELDLVGTAPDRQVAKLLGRTLSAVRSTRLRKGIRLKRDNFWTPKEIKLLGTKPDAEIARRLGRTPAAVALKRREVGVRSPSGGKPLRPWTPRELSWLGKKPDKEIARLTGRSRRSIIVQRLKRGLRDPSSLVWTEQELEWLRSKPVDEVVRLTGRSRLAVITRLSSGNIFPRRRQSYPYY